MSWEEKVTLGRTGLSVGRFGISASYGMGSREVRRAIDAGMNYAYWGSLRRDGFAEGLREMAPRRDSFVLVLQSYGRFAFQVRRSVEKGLRTLGLQHADLLLLGWWNRPVTERVLAAAAELRQRGLVRHLAVSTHARDQIAGFARRPEIGVIHLRYNAEHPGAEHDVFPMLPPDGGPGLVAYTATSWRRLMDPGRVPKGELCPTAGDCYRFVLSHPAVHVCLTGLSGPDQLDHALQARAKGPMSSGELAWMRRVGKAVGGYS
jgi:aryl-alcohol dehydrogenase-like predicted oxidoreductase